MQTLRGSWLSLGCAALSLSLLVSPAFADTLPFASGAESNGSSKTCVGWSNTPGSAGLFFDHVNAQGDCMRHYSVPLYWRTFSGAGTNRTITVRGRRPSAAQGLECVAFVYDSAGTLRSSDREVFPVTGSAYSTIELTVNNIVASGTSFVMCSPVDGLHADMRLLYISWSP